MSPLAWPVCAIAAISLVQMALGLVAVRRHASRVAAPAGKLPAMSILKPVHGCEPLLEEALTSFCDQDHPDFQIVFGLQDAHDPALPIIARLRARFPDTDMAIVIDPTEHGPMVRWKGRALILRRVVADGQTVASRDA